MEKESSPSTILDVSRTLGYNILYNPTIGAVTPSRYPFIFRPKNKNRLLFSK